MEAIRSIYEDDPDFAELVDSFASELPARALALEKHLGEGNLEELKRLAHQLKGAGGGYGFPKITEVAADLEQALKAGAEPPVLKDRTSKLCEVLRAVRGSTQA
jgi:HPt (histidine-containing phosphotransfer) domain-containing protein